MYSRKVRGVSGDDKTKFRCEWVDCGSIESGYVIASELMDESGGNVVELDV